MLRRRILDRLTLFADAKEKEPADLFRLCGEILCTCLELFGAASLPRETRALAEPPLERRLFLQRAKRGPQGAFHRRNLVGGQRVAGVGMSHATPKPQHLAVAQFPQDATAFRTRVRRGLARFVAFVFVHRKYPHFPHRAFRFERVDRHDDACASGKSGQQLADGGRGRDVIDVHVIEGVLRHRRKRGVRRILHDSHATGALDLTKSHGAVVEQPAQYDARHIRSVGERGAAEQGIDRRAVPVFTRPAYHPHQALLERQVKTRRCHVDVPATDAVAVDGVRSRQRTRTAEDVRQHTEGPLRHVKDDENGCGEPGGKARDQLLERSDASR